MSVSKEMDDLSLEGIVTVVVFSNPENGYMVLKLKTESGTVTASGCIPGIAAGENVVLHGNWTKHPQYGEQFKIVSFEIKPPTGSAEIYKYLASGAIKNIGPQKARDIVGKFGDDALHVVENEPVKLASIKGISMKNALKISADARRQTGLRRLFDFFAPYNIKPLIALRLYRNYGDEALETILENPYIMCGEPHGAQFSEADAIALDLGFQYDCIERVSAALLFELTHNAGNGHVFIPKDKLTAATNQLISCGPVSIAEGLEMLCEGGDIVIEKIAGVEACYLRALFEAERYTAQRVLEFALNTGKPEQLDDIISSIESKQSVKYAEKQRDAIRLAAGSGIIVLTGGPGTGKTTTVRGILMLFDLLGIKTVLCAPTGRAAKRLSETCYRRAMTIHRLLGASHSDEGGVLFEYDETNPLKADAVIVDESSMIDILLMRSLLSAMKPGSRIVMVGDADQLPSVGPGNVLSDVVKSEVVPVVVLSEIFRQAKSSGIVTCAHSVNKGIMPNLSEKHTDMFFLKRNADERLTETITELYCRRLPQNMGIDPSQIQVLSPTKKRDFGTVSLNKTLREAINPRNISKKEKQYGEQLFRVGDKVMQIKNNYDILWTCTDTPTEGMGVFNGELGVIADIDLERETVTVDFEDKLVTYLFEQLPELEHAFAMTVHKAQGSEYKAVILTMSDAAPQLLTRSVLYTAMSRAKNLLVIVGNPDIMQKMVNNDKRQRRYSGLRTLLKSAT